MSRIDAARRRAGAIGNEVRSRRAAVKKRIADGELDLAELLDSDRVDSWPSEEASTAEEIPIAPLLKSVPGIGPAIAGEILLDLKLNPNRPMGELGPEVRRRLASEIERT